MFPGNPGKLCLRSGNKQMRWRRARLHPSLKEVERSRDTDERSRAIDLATPKRDQQIADGKIKRGDRKEEAKRTGRRTCVAPAFVARVARDESMTRTDLGESGKERLLFCVHGLTGVLRRWVHHNAAIHDAHVNDGQNDVNRQRKRCECPPCSSRSSVHCL